MVLVYMMTAFVGSLAGGVLLWPYGALPALAGMPLGGSLLTLLVAAWISVRATRAAASDADRLERYRKLPSTKRP